MRQASSTPPSLPSSNLKRKRADDAAADAAAAKRAHTDEQTIGSASYKRFMQQAALDTMQLGCAARVSPR